MRTFRPTLHFDYIDVLIWMTIPLMAVGGAVCVGLALLYLYHGR